MITLPTSSISDISGVITGVFTDFKGLIFLVIGVILGLWLVEELFYLFKLKNEMEEFPGAEEEILSFREKYGYKNKD